MNNMNTAILSPEFHPLGCASSPIALVQRFPDAPCDNALLPDREVPDFVNIAVDFEDCSLMAMASTINEEGWPDSIRCNKGTILFTGSTIKVKPERSFADEVDGSDEQAPGDGEPIPGHHKNWIDCIRTNGVPNGNIDLAVRVQVMISLAERAFRESATFTFDPKTRTAKAGGGAAHAAVVSSAPSKVVPAKLSTSSTTKR